MHIMKKESERMLLLVERIREVVVVVELVVVFDGELRWKNRYYDTFTIRCIGFPVSI